MSEEEQANMIDQDIPLANSKVGYQTLMQAESCHVSKMTVLSGGQTQWHHHTGANDRLVVVQGVLTVECEIDGRVEKTQVRDYYNIAPGIRHHVKNETDEALVCIMVQSGGKQDIVL